MNETLVTLSRQNTPYVYLAFSEEANRRAASIGQHYVAKIGHAGEVQTPASIAKPR
ncbi:hypothetical protein ACVOMT_15895 [Sphingomonas panni]